MDLWLWIKVQQTAKPKVTFGLQECAPVQKTKSSGLARGVDEVGAARTAATDLGRGASAVDYRSGWGPKAGQEGGDQ